MGLELQADKTYSGVCDGCARTINLEIKTVNTATKWLKGLGWKQIWYEDEPYTTHTGAKARASHYKWNCDTCTGTNNERLNIPPRLPRLPNNHGSGPSRPEGREDKGR